MDFNNETIDFLINVIRNIVKDELAKQQKRNSEVLETYRNMRVTKVTASTDIEIAGNKENADDTISPENQTASLEDLVTGETVYNVPNKSGEVIKAGDIVRLYETAGGFFSGYIGLRCWKEE